MKPPIKRRQHAPDPAQLRQIFGTNLKQLCRSKPSISAVTRDLGINRTQFNRYISGESFPRPDILHLICEYFCTDARILLEPIAGFENSDCQLLAHPEIQEFYTPAHACDQSDMLPMGLYCFARQCFTDREQYIQGLSLVYHKQGTTFMRGLRASPAKSLNSAIKTHRSREWRGFIMQQSKGISALISWPSSTSCSYMFLANPSNLRSNIWSGYCTHSNSEAKAQSRVTRLIFEFIGKNLTDALKVRRSAGYCNAEALAPQHRKLLLPQQTFY